MSRAVSKSFFDDILHKIRLEWTEVSAISKETYTRLKFLIKYNKLLMNTFVLRNDREKKIMIPGFSFLEYNDWKSNAI